MVYGWLQIGVGKSGFSARYLLPRRKIHQEMSVSSVKIALLSHLETVGLGHQPFSTMVWSFSIAKSTAMKHVHFTGSTFILKDFALLLEMGS